MDDHPPEIEYIVIESHALSALARGVEQAALRGYKLQGGISIAIRSAGDMWCAQAMIRPTAT